VDVVPTQVTIGEKWLKSGATHPEPRGRRGGRQWHVDWGGARRPLTLLAVGFGSLAFAVTAHAGIDNSDTTTAAPAAPPPVAVAAPVDAAVPTSDAMTTAAAEDAQTVVSPQYPDQNAVPSPPPAADVPSAGERAGSKSSIDHRYRESADPARATRGRAASG
jgi:hypothetical protein